MFENISLAFQGIWSHKMRSILTMLGIIIGIAAIISIVSTIKGTNEHIKQNLIGAGNNAVTVQLYQGDEAYDYSWNAIPAGVPLLTEDTRTQLESLDEVELASYFNYRSYAENVYYLNTSFNGKVIGIDDKYFDVYGYYIQWGRNFLASDYEKFRKVVIIDHTAMSSLYPTGVNPIGTCIEIKGIPFTVVGVVDKKAAFEPVINSVEDYETYSQETSGEIYIPNASWCIPYQFDEPQSVVLKAVDTDSMTQAGNKAQDILNGLLSQSTRKKVSFKSEDLLKQAKNLQDLQTSTSQQLLWIASISLLVGGIGVMNIMLVSVTERTREIGLKKAIGAKKSRILWQFLTEAAVLTSLGGILGVVGGIIMARVISRLTTMPTAISVPAAAVAVLFSMAIGVIFGFFPAVKAANLNPIDALRHE
ncbi:MAG: ABC transporter permease [Lachnospiraceae bacterium]|nr:ABC transporter permease [Lachnospiraceae bacterium]